MLQKTEIVIASNDYVIQQCNPKNDGSFLQCGSRVSVCSAWQAWTTWMVMEANYTRSPLRNCLRKDFPGMN